MRRLTDDQDGAVAVIVVILLVAMFGMAAYAIDVGALAQERRELQNGADAAAFAIAEDCARQGPAFCTLAIIDPIADEYADYNASDLAADAAVDPTDFDPSGRLTVIASSRDGARDEPLLYHFFASIFNIEGTRVQARATVVFGGIGTLSIFPLAICEKHFMAVTENMAKWGPAAEDRIYYGNDKLYACPPGEKGDGSTYPGGFGFLELSDTEAAKACQTVRTTDNWHLGMNGDGLPASPHGKWYKCIKYLETVVDDGGFVNVPIYNDHRKLGGVPEFWLEGFARFHITGYNFGSGWAKYPDKYACIDVATNCIRGYFTEYVTLDGAVDADAGEYGGTTVQLVN